jgi:hypothetical protein
MIVASRAIGFDRVFEVCAGPQEADRPCAKFHSNS